MSWAQRAAAFVKPDNIEGNMGLRARLWRGFCDWNWGIYLEIPLWERWLWFARRLWK